MFRGNYVTLRYEISNLPVLGSAREGDRLCARLEESDGVWSARYVSPREPSGTVICGTARSDANGGETVAIEYGIETYYASAERAKELEREIAGGRLFVVVDLDDDGSARIEKIETG